MSDKKTLAQRMAEGDFLTVPEAAIEIEATNKIVRKLISTGRLVAEFHEVWWIQRNALDEVRVRKPGPTPERELTAREIRQIGRRRCSGEILRTIANDFNISVQRVSLIGLRFQRLKGRQLPPRIQNSEPDAASTTQT